MARARRPSSSSATRMVSPAPCAAYCGSGCTDSAGSEPGPVCYGRGGTQPTVTDADLVLGYLDPSYFLGGRMQLSLEATRQAILVDNPARLYDF